MSASPEFAAGDLTDDLRAVWSSIAESCADLEESQWDLPTRCPGWTVRDVLSHMIGTELMLAGTADPASEVGDAPHVRNDVGRFNEVSVDRRRTRSGDDVLAEFVAVTAGRLDALAAMTDEDMAEETWTPAGQATYGRFMQIRVFDCWMHELDIRAALGRPGGMTPRVVDRALTEMSTALGFVVGKKAGVPDGTSVAFVVEGDPGRRFDVVVDGRAALVDDPVVSPTATVTCGAADFAALCGGREDPRGLVASGAVALTGDPDVGERVITHMAFVI